VDDEPQMVKTFTDLFRFHGWEAVGVFSGEEALAALESSDYQVVLMDIRMPGMSGVEAFGAMKRLRPKIPVVLMTAYTAQELVDQARRDGVTAVLSKPLNVPALMRMLDEIVHHRGPVLIVDDDPQFLTTLGAVLRAKGYEVLESGGLKDALEQLEHAGPRIVLLDLRLNHDEPGEAIRAIREANSRAAIILYSGYPSLLDDTVGTVPPQWIHAAFHKPFPPEALLEVLDDALGD
jgi:CheY-like chemotaxis protein